MATAVFCIATSEFQAESIVNELKVAGFADNDISVLFPDKTGTKDFAHERHTKAPEGAVTGASTGGVLGGAAGAAVGGIAGALVGMGIPEFEAKRYEGKIRAGNILISVHSENNDEAKRAKEIFEQAGAQDISSSSEAGVKEKTDHRVS